MTDTLEIWDVDTQWGTRTSKGQDIQTGVIRSLEDVILELLTPWKVLDEGLGMSDKVIEDFRFRLVDEGHQTLEFGPDLQWVEIGLDKADVGLNRWSLILNPSNLTILKQLYITTIMMLNSTI